MKLSELIEKLADKEHESWARWQAYLHSKCNKLRILDSNALAIPSPLVTRWERQIKTAYEDLPEESKESDRNEVRIIIPLIYGFGRDFLTEEAKKGYVSLLTIEEWNRLFEEEGFHVY